MGPAPHLYHDWPVKQASVDLSIKKHTSGNLLSLLEAQNKDIGTASQTLVTEVTALFTNMRTLKFKSRLHNCVFHCRES